MIDKHSATWREIAAWAEGELAKASERIETLGVGPGETENLRGLIACLRELLSKPEPAEQRVMEKTQGYGFQDADEA